MLSSGQYAHCPPRAPVSYDISEKSLKAISAKCRVTPLYEKGVFEHIHRRHYSLQTNQHLACAWEAYKKNFETRVFAPFQFPDQRDIHFFNCNVRFLPSLTDHKRATFRKTFKPGPGIDYHGKQMPIPQELHMKRDAPKDAKGKKQKSSKTEQENISQK